MLLHCFCTLPPNFPENVFFCSVLCVSSFLCCFPSEFFFSGWAFGYNPIVLLKCRLIPSPVCTAGLFLRVQVSRPLPPGAAEAGEHRDFYQTHKVDTHIHMAAAMTGKRLLDFIVNKVTRRGLPNGVVGLPGTPTTGSARPPGPPEMPHAPGCWMDKGCQGK